MLRRKRATNLALIKPIINICYFSHMTFFVHDHRLVKDQNLILGELPKKRSVFQNYCHDKKRTDICSPNRIAKIFTSPLKPKKRDNFFRRICSWIFKQSGELCVIIVRLCRLFRNKQANKYLVLKEVNDLPEVEDVTVATRLLPRGQNLKISTNILWEAISQIHRWIKDWKIKLNDLKSINVKLYE